MKIRVDVKTRSLLIVCSSVGDTKLLMKQRNFCDSNVDSFFERHVIENDACSSHRKAFGFASRPQRG